MHIEPGILDASKVVAANFTAVATLVQFTPSLTKRLSILLKTALAAAFFSLFMEIFHMPVGASELHFVGVEASEEGGKPAGGTELDRCSNSDDRLIGARSGRMLPMHRPIPDRGVTFASPDPPIGTRLDSFE